MNLNFYGHTTPNPDHPEENRDAYLLHTPTGVAGVFDGVGLSGAPASKLATYEIQKSLDRQVAGRSDQPEFLERLLKSVDAHIRDRQNSTTTAALARIVGESLQVSHAGDSRVYRFSRKDGLLQCLTLDHGIGFVEMDDDPNDEREAWRQQELLSRATEEMELRMNGRDLEAFRHRNVITSCLGHTNPAMLKIRTKQWSFNPTDDVVLLTTDGIHDNLAHGEIEDILRLADLKSVPEKLIGNAAVVAHNDGFRAKRDDMTAVIMVAG